MNISALASCFNEPMWEEYEIKTKPCIYCKEEKPLNNYTKHKMMKDGLDSRCKQCCRKLGRRTRLLAKTAPPKPDVCECCGVNPETKQYKAYWVLDHDHDTDLFRGWLCDSCNIGLGLLGDNLKGIMKAVKYFKSRQVDDKI